MLSIEVAIGLIFLVTAVTFTDGPDKVFGSSSKGQGSQGESGAPT